MEEIKILKMSREHAEDVHQLGMVTKQLQAFEDRNAYYSVDHIMRATESKNEICLVAYVGEKFAGFIITSINPVFNEAYFSDVSVKPEFQGLGIGHQFFAKTDQILKTKDVSWGWALVHEDNDRMQTIMEKMGFVKGRKFFFYVKDF